VQSKSKNLEDALKRLDSIMQELSSIRKIITAELGLGLEVTGPILEE